MKKLSTIFVAFAVFCFIVLASCGGSTSKPAEEAASEEMVEEAAEEVMEEAVDSMAADTSAMMMEEEAETAE